MSDDLVKRLRVPNPCCEEHHTQNEAADRIEALTAERDELQQVFDFQWRANMRAVEMWRTANPGNDLVLPDSAKLTVWMLEQLEAARADAKEAEAYAEELAGDQVDLCRQLIAAEDKLAKAVEALREIVVDDTWGLDHKVYMKCRKVLREIEGNPCPSCREPLSLPSGEGCAAMTNHAP